ncbi:MAG: ParA family protein [Magnetococcales bacterium]|nr:ParA family protein [Magnetococcales bacterium]
MTQSSVAGRLLTWLDVERYLKQRTALWRQLPDGVLTIDCFADGMEIRHFNERDQVDEWLAGLFGRAFDRAKQIIHLRIGEASYPVLCIQEAENHATVTGRSYPLWQDVTYLPPVEPEQADMSVTPVQPISPEFFPSPWSTAPGLVSFHSFKGGVGRTTALMTYVAACMQSPIAGPKRILVVDADLEAPGISFWLNEGNRPSVSFVQLLEALHYPPTDVKATLDFFADELRKTSLTVAGMQRQLFILPVALKLTDIQDMSVTPEHLARNPDNPWQLSDHLHELGSRLGVDAVFIDLRAGLSELSSPILFDPRVDHFFVSTVAPQSVQGTREMLRCLYGFNRRLPVEQRDNARPAVVLSLLTKELREADHYEQAMQVLDEVYPADDVLTQGLQWLEADFLNPLMSIGSVQEALQELPHSIRLFASASEWVSTLYLASMPVATTAQVKIESPKALSRRTSLENLEKICKDAQFAEGDDSVSILAIEPLLNLGKHYTKELPNLLMIGAKGAGKTFTYRQLVKAGAWPIFLEKIGFKNDETVDAAIFPVLWSKNIPDKPQGEIKKSQNQVISLIGGDPGSLRRYSSLSDSIDKALANPPESWEYFWDHLITSQLGVDDGGLHELNRVLATHARRVILVFDGIEDAFQDTANSHAVKAINGLLSLTDRISELDNRHIGAMIFVRMDYVQDTVRQNLGQLLQRFEPYRLQWNPESFLRLAFMLSCQAGIISADPESESLGIEPLKNKLQTLWGKKLGSDKSKEAYSARWVYSALCDLQGKVQARDLVRFLRFSAALESARNPWPDRSDRSLSPESMRRAIPKCSQEKVDEARKEIASLRTWAELMERNNVRGLKVPFKQAEAQLEPDILRALKEIGVVYEDLENIQLGEERLYLPEIYRHGLGFDLAAAGRPRIQALLKKNIGSIPL